ncbi:hypothetical protein cand_038350 [Cryptosporidium andersoni]|uniref:Condensin-2 complex subunit H2 C-terminal domain-containing protein n=1 Tax=Cryptosporidium andersoni TaxID=117008 RepID=A0A1J4MUY9_9CRYT|nr:hypothetical protein cand_038350 [Cryptosporidium andersoni]
MLYNNELGDSLSLLRSIECKDLSLNWNIDVSAELEKYLSALETLEDEINYSQSTENMNDNSHSSSQLFNFAEAALIIQNSTNIYSKKIEHLHTLVYETLKLLSLGNSNKLEYTSSINNCNVEQSTNMNGDIRKPTNNKGTAFLMDNIFSVPLELLQSGRNVNISLDTKLNDKIKGELKGMNIICSPFIGVSQSSCISLPIYRIDPSTFTLFLDESDICLLEDNSSFCENISNSKENCSDYNKDVHNASNYDNINEYTESNIDMEYNIEDDLALSSNYINEKGMITCNNILEGESTEAVIISTKKNKNDPWELMDEHIKIGRDRAIKQGRSYKIPTKSYTLSLVKMGEKAGMLNFINKYSIRSYLMGLTQYREEKDINYSSAQYIPFFCDLKKPILLSDKMIIQDQFKNCLLASLEVDIHNNITAWRKYYSKQSFGNAKKKDSTLGDINVDDLSLCETDNRDDICFDNNNEFEDVNICNIDECEDSQQYSADIVDDHILEDFITSNIQQGNIEDDQKIGEFDLEDHMTDLHARINSWTEYLEPILEIQNKRPDFDIKSEGEKIIEKIRAQIISMGIDSVKFSSIVEGLPKWQISRSFLATLMLSNNKDIEISSIDNESNEDEEFIKGEFVVKLRSINDDNIKGGIDLRLLYPKKKKMKQDESDKNISILDKDQKKLKRKLRNIK